MYRHKVQLLQCFKEMCSLVAHPRLLGGGENTVVGNKKLPTARWTDRRKKNSHLHFRYRGWETDAANRNSGVSLKLHYNRIRLEHVTRPPRSTVCSKKHETSAFEWDCLLLSLTH